MKGRSGARRRSCTVAAVCAASLTLAISVFSTGVGSASESRSPRTGRPWVSFELKSPSEVHTINTARVCSHDVPAHGYVSYLEQRVGTAHVWRFVLGLHVKGTACTTHRFREPLPGVLAFRVQLWHAKKVIYQSPEHTLTVFGHVSFVGLCNEGLVLAGFLPNLCQTMALQIGNTIFTYLIADAEATTAPRYDMLIEVPRTSCNRLVVHMGVGTDGPSATSATVELVQSTSAPHVETLKVGHVRTFAFRLDGGPWNLDDWTATADTVAYYNGYANCWSLSGIR
jgi:hypothetical protein